MGFAKTVLTWNTIQLIKFSMITLRGAYCIVELITDNINRDHIKGHKGSWRISEDFFFPEILAFLANRISIPTDDQKSKTQFQEHLSAKLSIKLDCKSFYTNFKNILVQNNLIKLDWKYIGLKQISRTFESTIVHSIGLEIEEESFKTFKYH